MNISAIVTLVLVVIASSDAYFLTRNNYEDKMTMPLANLQPARKMYSSKSGKNPFYFLLEPGPVIINNKYTVGPLSGLGAPIESENGNRPLPIMRYGNEWENCGSSSDPVKLDLYFSNPLVLPGDVTVSLNATLKTELKSPLALEVTLLKELDGQYIEVPCIDNIGSCKYDDLCELLSKAFPPDEDCPKPFITNKIPCNCPFKKGDYVLPTSNFTVSKVPSVSPSLINGHYKITAKISANGQQLACYTTSKYIDVEIKNA